MGMKHGFWQSQVSRISIFEKKFLEIFMIPFKRIESSK